MGVCTPFLREHTTLQGGTRDPQDIIQDTWENLTHSREEHACCETGVVKLSINRTHETHMKKHTRYAHFNLHHCKIN